MRFTILALTLAFASPATPLEISNFETRADCLERLQHALRFSENSRSAAQFEAEILAQAPDAANAHVETAIEAVNRRAKASADYADALMLICQSYD